MSTHLHYITFFFCNSEVMTSFPHLTASFWTHTIRRFNLYNFLLNWFIFVKSVAKCSAFVSLSYKVLEKVCNPIPFKAECFGFGYLSSQ